MTSASQFLDLPNNLKAAIARAGRIPARRESVRYVVRLMDLGAPDGADDWVIERLANQATTPAGSVAGLTVDGRSIPVARRLVGDSGTRVVAVLDVSVGVADVRRLRDEVSAAVADGADEVEMAFPVRAWRSGDRSTPGAAIASAKSACGSGTLKVSMEGAAFDSALALADAAAVAAAEGADFLQPALSLRPDRKAMETASVLMDVLRGRVELGKSAVGLKLTGLMPGIEPAIHGLAMASHLLGRDMVKPGTLRVGAEAALLADALRFLETSG